jgi:hypothetical protein
MLHSQIEREEFVERYVGDRLTAEERQAFEEHFFACDECFEKLQATERFAVGMRDAAERGRLLAPLQETNPRWFGWALPATASIALVMAGLLGWAYFGQMPRLRSELRQTVAQLKNEEQAQARAEQAVPVEQAEANVPLVMLEASRADEQPPIVTLNRNDNRLILWIEPGPSRYRDYRLEVFSSDNKLVTSVDHLEPGRYGALATSLPTKQLPGRDFRITLTGQDPPPPALAGEYHLEIRRP